MPYFKWHGTDASGQVCQGTLFARSPAILEQLLAQQKVTFLTCAERPKPSFSHAPFEQRAVFFQQMGSLISAGVSVVDALSVAHSSVSHRYFRLVIEDCRQAIEEGNSLSQACAFHADFFTPFACQILMAGEESGSLGKSCAHLAQYYFEIDGFMKKIRSALLVPLITIGMFLVVVGVLFIAVIPRFATILTSLHKPLPVRTQVLIAISAWIGQHTIVFAVGGALGLLVLAHWLVRQVRHQIGVGGWILYVPVAGTWVRDAAISSFFKTMGALLVGGVDISRALSLATMGIRCAPLRMQFEAVTQAVHDGASLTDALHAARVSVPPACAALLAIGENSGTLGPMLLACAEHCQAKLYRMLERGSTLVQPVVLMVLGILIAGLIFSLYEPLFTLGSSIDF